jgi:hypothetical protein
LQENGFSDELVLVRQELEADVDDVPGGRRIGLDFEQSVKIGNTLCVYIQISDRQIDISQTKKIFMLSKHTKSYLYCWIFLQHQHCTNLQYNKWPGAF